MGKIKDIMIVTEHVMEIRHIASGRFLDVRGFIADHFKSKDLFPHWQIDSNIVQFRDDAETANKIGAFVGYKSAGIYSFDPDSRNYFEEKAGKFWKTLTEFSSYNIPDIQRFGCRTKAFINCKKPFDEIHRSLFDKFFTSEFHQLLSDKANDMQIVVNLTSAPFQIKIHCGPIHKEEANNLFNFRSDHFQDTGIFLDIDVYKIGIVQNSTIPNLVKDAMKLSWVKIDSISKSVGL